MNGLTLLCDVRYTDQNPQGTALLFGGYGYIKFHPDEIELVGIKTHHGTWGAAADILMSFNPFAHAANTLVKANQPAEIVALPKECVDSVIFDPARLRFAVIARPKCDLAQGKRLCWPFQAASSCGLSPMALAENLRKAYPDKYCERRLPMENRRLLTMFAILLILASVPLTILWRERR